MPRPALPRRRRCRLVWCTKHSSTDTVRFPRCPAMQRKTDGDAGLTSQIAGQITVVDSDTVEMSNLHRQVLHTQDRVGMSKARSAQIGMNA